MCSRLHREALSRSRVFHTAQYWRPQVLQDRRFLHSESSQDFQPFGQTSTRDSTSIPSHNQKRADFDFEQAKEAIRKLESLKFVVDNSGNSYDAEALARHKELKIQMEKQQSKMHRVQRALDSRPPMRKKQKNNANAFLPEGTSEEILAVEAGELIHKFSIGDAKDSETKDSASSEKVAEALASTADSLVKPDEIGTEIELDIVGLSSTGDGLAYNKAGDHIFVVPFTVPGDRVLARPFHWYGKYSISDFVKVIRPSPEREGMEPKCKYFAQCGGCQFQMLPYETQLKHKQGILRRAFQHFSGLNPMQLPDVLPTMGSPLQYGYRTKLTPHFNGPKRSKKFDGVPEIGFNMKGRRKTMDIESCPIGTEILQKALTKERQNVHDNIHKYTRGATINVRERTQRRLADGVADPAGLESQSIPSDLTALPLQSKTEGSSQRGEYQIKYTYEPLTDTKTYTSDENSLATEYVTTTVDTTTTPHTTKTYKFTNRAGSFFQNNNSILGAFTSYIYSQCHRPSDSAAEHGDRKKSKYLLDAYSGSGLFTLTLSTHFKSSLGIDIDALGIKAARENAAANGVKNVGFIDADASQLFADVPYPPDQTVVVIDPPRKGCDREFLRQLRSFGADRVIYVSCNVHTQARDVGVLVNGFAEKDRAEFEVGGLCRYEIESLKGFDFFPQTGHVEGVCVLNKVIGT